MEDDDLLEQGADPIEDTEAEGMEPEKFKGVLKAAIEDAVSYIDESVAPDRAKATRYYKGEPLGNEEGGRSQIVMTEVRDTIQTMMPELLKIFCESDQPVEFIPNNAAAVKDAEQQTDYISHIVMQDNDGVKLFFDVFKDALIRKTGVVKWYIDDSEEVTEEDFSGLSPDQYAMLINDEEVGLDNEIMYMEKVSPETGELSIDCRIKRVSTERRYRVESIPPEEFYCARNSRDLDTTDLCGHRRYMTLSDLVSMGYDEQEIIEKGGGSASNFVFNEEATARNPALQSMLNNSRENGLDPAMKVFEYYESYIRTDWDEDGIAELRKVCSIGQSQHILHNEVVAEVPMAVFCPDPEPHMLIGQSVADQVMDLQRIKTAVVRNTLDSLAQTVNPRTAIIEGAVNMDDVMNTETGAIIRTRMAGAVMPLVEPFVGQYALPIIQYLDEVRASRTGITKASQGLDPDVLQSTTKAAVTSTMSAAQSRIGLVARVFAETGMRRLFRGLLRLVTRSQDKPRMMKMRGEWVEVDPRAWDASNRMIVNVGLGSGMREEKLAILSGIAAKQEVILQTLGPINPLCTIKHYRHTLGKMVELSGHKDVSNYFSEITDEHMQQFAEAQAQDKKPDPAEVLAAIEKMKVEGDLKIAGDKNTIEAAKLKMGDDRERDRIVADVLTRLTDIETRTGIPVNAMGILNEINRDRGDFNGAGTGAPLPPAVAGPIVQ